MATRETLGRRPDHAHPPKTATTTVTRPAAPAPAQAQAATGGLRFPATAKPLAPRVPLAAAGPTGLRAPGTPVKRPAATTPPSAHVHWQLLGKPGEHLVLMPGQMHLGKQASSVKTLLGSCVAITLWHPTKHIGGMCHFLLPQRNRQASDPLDGRYGDEAVEAMVKSLRGMGAHPEEFVAHLYGGADTMSASTGVRFNIGERNIEKGWTLIDKYGFQLDGVDVGEDIPRMVLLSMDTGEVNMRRGTGQAPDHLRG
jgi:chemotaxis protein CheD